MAEIPATRPSLLVRLRDPRDGDARPNSPARERIATVIDEESQGGRIFFTSTGALSVPDADQSLDVKQLQHRAEKQRIAAAAAELIGEGETIILDSGTTTAEIMPTNWPMNDCMASGVRLSNRSACPGWA